MIFRLLQGEIHVFTPTFREVGKLGSSLDAGKETVVFRGKNAHSLLFFCTFACY